MANKTSTRIAQATLLATVLGTFSAVIACGPGGVRGGYYYDDPNPTPTSSPTTEPTTSAKKKKKDAGSEEPVPVTPSADAGGGGTTTSGDAGTTTVAPPPVLQTLTPLTKPAGSPDTPLTVAGNGFANDAKIVFGGTELPTTYKSASELSATIPAAKLAAPGTVQVLILNPSLNAQRSQPINFTITQPDVQVTLTSLTPSKVLAGSAATTVAIVGTGFQNGSQVKFNNRTLNTTYTSPTQVSAAITADLLTTPGDFPVTVTTAGKESAPLPFRVEAEQITKPVLTSITPSTVTVGAAATTITVNGSNFVSGKTGVAAGGFIATSTFVSSTQMTASVAASNFTTAGTVKIKVYTLTAQGTGVYADTELAITVEAAGGTAGSGGTAGTGGGGGTVGNTPVFTSFYPGVVPVGSISYQIVLNGSNFTTDVGVSVQGRVAPTERISDTEIRAIIDSSYFTTATVLKLRIYNLNDDGTGSYAANEGSLLVQ
ncbi:MAG: IPT/TIG domain-containing protein [Polyangiaceae bacterium]